MCTIPAVVLVAAMTIVNIWHSFNELHCTIIILVSQKLLKMLSTIYTAKLSNCCFQPRRVFIADCDVTQSHSGVSHERHACKVYMADMTNTHLAHLRATLWHDGVRRYEYFCYIRTWIGATGGHGFRELIKMHWCAQSKNMLQTEKDIVS